MVISLTKTYENRQILLLGGLGFLGKVLLVMLLYKFPEIRKIYLILRPGKHENAQTRFWESLKTCPAFDPLRNQKGGFFLDFIKQKVVVLEGDISQPDFGLSSHQVKQDLNKNIDLVINAAGLVSFDPDFRDAFSGNVESVMQAAQFVKESEKASLLHVSTCYVAGNISGLISEELKTDLSPNQQNFDVELELEKIRNQMRVTRNREVLKKFGVSRASKWGWPNLYTYTKALGEAWLDRQKYFLNMTIVRPSILESAVSFPFAGWNQGFNTSAPILKFLGTGFPFIVVNKESVIDILPIDFFCMQMLKIGAALLHRSQAYLYQCGTSYKNPLLARQMMMSSRKRQRAWIKNDRNISWKQKALFYLDFKAVPPGHFLSSSRLLRLLDRLPLSWRQKSETLKHWAENLQIFSKIEETFFPFMYSNNYIFESKSIDKIQVEELDWDVPIDQINWEKYWAEIHMPGVEKWCFSQATL